MVERKVNEFNDKEWMTAYKLMRLGKDGNVYPLFINRKKATRFGEVLQAEFLPRKGFQPRKGWHCCFQPVAPHLKENLASGERRVWVEVKVKDWESYDRPESQGGKWILAQNMIAVRIMNEDDVIKVRRVA